MIAGFGQAVCAPPRPAVLASHLPPLCEADGAAFAPNSWIHLLRQMIRPRKSKASTDQAVVCRLTNLPTLFFSQKLIDVTRCANYSRGSPCAHHQDVVGFRQTGKWRGQLLSEEVNEAHRIGQAAASKLSVRASGQQVREIAGGH